MENDISQLAILKKDLSNDERMQFDMQYSSRVKKPSTALILSLFLGTLGIDRFYLGQMGMGFAKLFTLGGLWLWAIIDWFLIMNATRRLNTDTARLIHASIHQIR